MVKRWKIRSKLIIAMVCLTIIVTLLASSGLWGLYRYRQLAHSVSKIAMEIPRADALNRTALSLQASHLRSSELRSVEGMLQSVNSPILDIEQLENLRFDDALNSFDWELSRYESQLSASNLLVDAARQRRSLGEIRASYQALEEFLRKPQVSPYTRKAELKNRLASLVTQTEENLKTLHHSMAKFSDEVRGQYRTWISVAWSSLGCVMAIIIVLWIAFHSLVVKPFRTLLGGSRLVARGQFSHRIDLGTGDELSELAFAMNDMTQRFQDALQREQKLCSELDQQVKDRTRELIRGEQLASVGNLAAGVAHEINNPLATIAWSAESLQSTVMELTSQVAKNTPCDHELVTEITENLRRIEDEAYRCKGITEGLLDFSRLGNPKRDHTNLSRLVEEVVSLIGKVGKYHCTTIEVDFDASVTAYANSHEIRQVILNLVSNALECVDQDGKVRVSVTSDGEFAKIVVKDNGCGMTEEVMQHLFEPYFTRRRDGTGTGLGLSISYQIISKYGGSLIAHSDGEGCGSRMEIILPVEPANKDVTSSHRIDLDRHRQPRSAQPRVAPKQAAA